MVEPGKTGASSSKEQTPAAEPTSEPIPSTAKVELKDGKVFVEGKDYVRESDLIAVKRSLEQKLEQAQTVHDQAIDKAKLELSEAQQQVASLNARIKSNEEAHKLGAVTDEEAARVKQELETTKSSIVALTAEAARALDYRRALLVMQYGISADTIKDKDMKSLDSFEEALKAVSTAKGSGSIGPYAIGGGTGEAAPQTPIERAAKILASTPVRGTRTAETQ